MKKDTKKYDCRDCENNIGRCRFNPYVDDKTRWDRCDLYQPRKICRNCANLTVKDITVADVVKKLPYCELNKISTWIVCDKWTPDAPTKAKMIEMGIENKEE